MPDVFTPAKRSEVMSRIRSHGNKDTEQRLAAVFRAHGITGWRRQIVVSFPAASGRGKVRPDFVFRAEKLAVFVDGCFWHGCPDHAVAPKNNAEWWRAKLAANRDRDRRKDALLIDEGWLPVHVWEHEAVSPAADQIVTLWRHRIGQ